MIDKSRYWILAIRFTRDYLCKLHLFASVHYNIVKTLSGTVTDLFGIELSQLQTGVGNNENLVSVKEEE